VARYLPGLGDPMDMDLPELDAWMEAITDVLKLEGGGGKGDGSSGAGGAGGGRGLHG